MAKKANAKAATSKPKSIADESKPAKSASKQANSTEAKNPVAKSTPPKRKTAKPSAEKRKPVAKAKSSAKSAPALTDSNSDNKNVSAASYTLEQRFASLDEARSATIDALLHTIEDAERRLMIAKRASTFTQLEQLTNEHP